MDASEELPKKVFKARKTMRASDRQQLEAIYKSREEHLKSNDESKPKLCNGKHENGDSDGKNLLNTNCMDDADGINDVRLGPEELQGNSIDEIVTNVPELSTDDKSLEQEDSTPKAEKMDSKPLVAVDEQQIPTVSCDTALLSNTSRGEASVKLEHGELKEESLVVDRSHTDSQSLSEEKNIPSESNSGSQNMTEENTVKLQTSSPSVRDKEDSKILLDTSELIGEEAITSSIESVQEKGGCEESKMECTGAGVGNVDKEKTSERKSAGNIQLQMEEIIPILEKLAPEKENNLSNDQNDIPPIPSPAPMDSPFRESQDEQMEDGSSPTKEDCNGNLPEGAFLVLSDEDEPVIETPPEVEEVVLKPESTDKDHKEQAAETRQEPEPNEVISRKRFKSEDKEDSISKRRRFSGEEYEAALKVKITARGEIHETLEKIVHQIIQERLSSMQSGIFEKKLAELKKRVEKIECNKRHESLISGLQAKLMQIEKRLGSADQARNSSAAKKAQEMPALFQQQMQFDLDIKDKLTLTEKGQRQQFGKILVDNEQIPQRDSRISLNSLSQAAMEQKGVVFQDRTVYITFHKPITKKQQNLMPGHKIISRRFDSPVPKNQQAPLPESRAPYHTVKSDPQKQSVILPDQRWSETSDKPIVLTEQVVLDPNPAAHSKCAESAASRFIAFRSHRFSKCIVKHKVPLHGCRTSAGKPIVVKQKSLRQCCGAQYTALAQPVADTQPVVLHNNSFTKLILKREVPLQDWYDCRISALSNTSVMVKQQPPSLCNGAGPAHVSSTTDKHWVALQDNVTHCDTVLESKVELPLQVGRNSLKASVQLPPEKQPVKENQELPLQRDCSQYRTSVKSVTQLHVVMRESKMPCGALGGPVVDYQGVISEECQAPCSVLGEPIIERHPPVLQESKAPCVDQQILLPDNSTLYKLCIPGAESKTQVIVKDSSIPYNTKRATAWGVRAWDEWAKKRNHYLMNNTLKSDESFLYVPTLSHEITHDELSFWLCRFVEDVHRQDGSWYPPNSLRLLCCSILRYLRETCKRLDIDFFNKYSLEYSEFRTVLEHRMKQLKQQGIGMVRKQAQPYTEEEEENLWQVVFHLRDAKSYSYTVYFYLCKVFGVHAAAEHNKLRVDQFSFASDELGEYLEFVAKPYRDEIQRPKRHTRQYADLSNPRCIVSVFRRYLGMIPSEGPFYRRPIPRRLELCRQAIGVHSLERYSKEICEAGNIKGRHTGQSGRNTPASTPQQATGLQSAQPMSPSKPYTSSGGAQCRSGTVRQMLDLRRNMLDSTSSSQPLANSGITGNAPSFTPPQVVSGQSKPQNPGSSAAMVAPVLPTSTALVGTAQSLPNCGNNLPMPVSLQSVPVLLTVPVAMSSQPPLLQASANALVTSQQTGLEFLPVQSQSTLSVSKAAPTHILPNVAKANGASPALSSPGAQQRSMGSLHTSVSLSNQTVSLTSSQTVLSTQIARTSQQLLGSQGHFSLTNTRPQLQPRLSQTYSQGQTPGSSGPPSASSSDCNTAGTSRAESGLALSNQKPSTASSEALVTKKAVGGGSQNVKAGGSDAVIDLTGDDEDDLSAQGSRKQNASVPSTHSQPPIPVPTPPVSAQAQSRPVAPSQAMLQPQSSVPIHLGSPQSSAATIGLNTQSLSLHTTATGQPTVSLLPQQRPQMPPPTSQPPVRQQLPTLQRGGSTAVVYTTAPAYQSHNTVRAVTTSSQSLSQAIRQPSPQSPSTAGVPGRLPHTATSYIVNNVISIPMMSSLPQFTVHHRPPQPDPPRPIHPAPLPEAQPPQRLPPEAASTALPQKPHLKLARVQSQNGIVLSWSVLEADRNCAPVDSYHLYAYHEDPATTSASQWKKIGEVKALPLPMACTLTQFVSGSKYYFAVRAKDLYGRYGPFCDPQSTDVMSTQGN